MQLNLTLFAFNLKVAITELRFNFTDTPFGQLPMLEADGIVLCQSRTIGRYLANKFGKYYLSAIIKILVQN